MSQALLFDAKDYPTAQAVSAPALSAEASRAARDDGMARAEAHADEGWKASAYRAVLAVAVRLGEFTSDDVWATGLPHPVEGRALGPVLMRLAREGRVAKTGQFRKTRQISRHAADVAVWMLVR